ncbi:hypothetical protein LshimejAT787_0401640 [Lyophyllum shimeji]|uniref:Carboxymuconolactone decarboxylase-like domain-containing protein n=1 Tax=Lyophyllum shimeji TaxID=47721 RepID=A0A9P3PKG1_LYOSH|nr:hypothetical protein LshimejAT787_0401640 [Lyophyllum shimeji]
MTLRPLFLLLAVISFAFSSLGVALRPHTEEKRDDNFPARVPYVFPAPGTDPIADAIRARRANGTLLALDGVLLNAPLVASTWNSLFGVIRNNTTLPGNMRELIILRIAALNEASYEWLQHEPVGRSEGLTTAQLRVVRLTPAFNEGAGVTNTLGASLAAMMTFTDWSTKTAKVPDRVFANLQKVLNNQQLVEAAATVGGYNFVSRFLLALDVDGKNNAPVPIPN